MGGEGDRVFKAALTAEMRDCGLRGQVARVSAHEGALRLEGEAGGELLVPASSVRRIRIGAQSGRVGPVYRSYIWRNDEPERLTLHLTGEPEAYAAVMTAFAGASERAGAVIEAGTSRFDALFLPVTTGLLALAVSVIVPQAMGGDPAWARSIPLLLAWSIFGSLSWYCVATRWPRRVRGLDGLARYLPAVAPPP